MELHTGLYEFDDSYRILSKLGEGGFGSVYKVQHRHTGLLYAAKVLDTVSRFEYCSRTRQNLPAEIVYHMRLEHPNLIRYIDHFCTDQGAILILEYNSDYTDLHNYLWRRRKKMDEIRCASIVSQLISVLSYLHRKGYDHRDVKLENILYSGKTKQLKLIDLGCAERLARSKPYRQVRGTEAYYPPEWFDKGEFLPSDGIVWSVGLVAYQLLNSSLPFSSSSRDSPVPLTCAHRRKRRRSTSSSEQYRKIRWRNERISAQGKKFIKRCLRASPSRRFTFEEMKNAKWLTLSTFV